jgi:hypothetical protein
MRLWRFTSPVDDTFAEGGQRGSWSAPAGGRVCPECSSSRQSRIQPLLLAWLPGSDLVGDFTWCGLAGEVAVTERVVAALRGHCHGFEPGAVEMVEDNEASASRRGKPRVRLPYSGPALHELWVTTWVHLDRDGSSVELERTCGTCHTEFWEVFGVERWDSHYDPERRRLVRTKTERLPKAGVFVQNAELAGASIFRVHEFPGWVFCTDVARALIQKEGFTNVAFLEMGETLNAL